MIVLVMVSPAWVCAVPAASKSSPDRSPQKAVLVLVVLMVEL